MSDQQPTLGCDCGRPDGRHTRLNCGVPIRSISVPLQRGDPRRRTEWGRLKNLPISAATTIAGQYGMRQVIIIALNAQDDTAHVVTYGKSEEDCRLAAEAGNNLKRHMGWPDGLCSAVPERLVRTK